MLDTESPAMETNGDSFLPDLPVLGQATDWSLDQVASEQLTNILPADSDASHNAEGQQEQADPQIDSTELGSVEKAVEQFQLASAQLLREEQPPQPTEEPEQPSEHKEDSVDSKQHSQEMSAEPEAHVQDGSQGSQNSCFLVIDMYMIYIQAKLVSTVTMKYATLQEM